MFSKPWVALSLRSKFRQLWTWTMSISIPFFPYRLFFLYIEPISALLGAYYAAFKPEAYLKDLSLNALPSSSLVSPLSTQTNMALLQLANLYFLFALNEHFVLSSTSSLVTWRRLLIGLLIADFGHLVTMAPLGSEVFWRVWDWNAMVWGSVGFVYIGASMRLCFLVGIGLSSVTESRRQKEAWKAQHTKLYAHFYQRIPNPKLIFICWYRYIIINVALF